MATTKVIPEVLDLRGGLPDYSLAATNTVTYLDAGGGNQYNFNGAYGLYGVVNGTYVLSSVSSSHPIAILNNGKTSLISYTGAVNEGSQTAPDGNTYTYYSGDVTITVSGNFDVVSYACKVHGYMGGQNNLIYTDLHSDLGLKIPTGSATNRPATNVTGMVRNTTYESSQGSASSIEYYNGSEWKAINNTAVPPVPVNFLVVAGGGGGGTALGDGAGGIGGGGAGAGGLRTSYGSTSGGGSSAESSLSLTTLTTYTITVGSGGTGNTKGSDSIFSSITSEGGGDGGDRFGSAGDGGSGGAEATDAGGTPGQGTANQGFNGGATGGSGTGRSSAGGGGAAAAGGTINSTTGGGGGVALAVSITGSSVFYAGGGGGGAGGTSSQNGGAGGSGVGGNGGNVNGGNGGNGTVNTGSGGGGAAGGTTTGGTGTGGSGIVILRLSTADYSGNTSGSPTVTTDGSDTILTYTGSGTYTA
jgi:hypothetical protein